MESSGSTAQEFKFSVKDFFNKCEQIRKKSGFAHMYKRNLCGNCAFPQKFPHQEIRWSHGILRSGRILKYLVQIRFVSSNLIGNQKAMMVLCFIDVCRSSHRRYLVKKGVLRNFAKFARKHLCQSLFFNKVPGLQLYWKKRLWHRCFLANFAKFLRTPVL